MAPGWNWTVRGTVVAEPDPVRETGGGAPVGPWTVAPVVIAGLSVPSSVSVPALKSRRTPAKRP